MEKKEIDEFKKKVKDKVAKAGLNPNVSFTYVKREEWGIKTESAAALLRNKLGITEHASNKTILTDKDSILIARRTKAILNSRDEIMSRYDFGHMDWILCNCGVPLSDLQAQFQILFAAAVWILDCLADAGTDFSKLYKLLPQERDLLNRLPDLPVKDCKFDNDLIRSVEYVLCFRNGDSDPKKKSGVISQQTLFTKTTAAQKIKPDLPCRQAYEKMIALIPKHKIKEAVDQYQACHQAWIDSFFETIRPFCKETDEIAAWIKEWKQKRNDVARELKELTAAAKKEYEKKPGPTREELLALHDGIQQRNSASLDYSLTAPKQHIEDMENLRKRLPNSMRMMDRINESAEENDTVLIKTEREQELKKKRQAADLCYRSILHYRLARAKKLIPSYPDIQCPQLPVGDGYGICFALLYLIEQGSDLPWLYGPSTAIAEQAALNLPWISPGFMKELVEDLKTPARPAVPAKEESVAVPDWSERKYYREGEKDDPDFRWNLAQISMEVNDCLAPRDLHVPRSILDKLHAFGLQGDALNIFLYAMSGFHESTNHITARNFDEDYMQTLLQNTGAPQRISRAELEAKAAEQEDEIRKLRAALRDAERQSAQNEKKLSELQEKTQIERQELYDLREYVFNLNAADDEKQDTDAVIPEKQTYTVQKNTIIVGGHDSWLKAFRQMLKGKVRYIDREQNFDTGMIRSADVIWIQLNALSHSQFYKVTDAAKKYRKQIRMFRQASAWKCAEQVAENDKL